MNGNRVVGRMLPLDNFYFPSSSFSSPTPPSNSKEDALFSRPTPPSSNSKEEGQKLFLPDSYPAKNVT